MILDEYEKSAPSSQNAIDLFKDEWSSKFPGNFAVETKPGTAALFEDPRIAWANTMWGGFKGRSILELGPLECGHTSMLQNYGARSILAVEANKRSFVKCLIAKEICGIHSANIVLGDFNEYLETSNEQFDWVLASGVLYHVRNPLKLLKNISDCSSKLVLWTHYYDETIIQARPDLKIKFDEPKALHFMDNEYTAAKQMYLDALKWNGFCGGSESDSIWLTKESLLRCLNNFGYTQIEIASDDSYHQNGPALLLAAAR